MKKVLIPRNITILLLVIFAFVTFTFQESYKYNRIFLILFILNLVWGIYYEKKGHYGALKLYLGIKKPAVGRQLVFCHLSFWEEKDL